MKIRKQSYRFHRRRWQQGFTLMEMLIIIAMMCIFGVIAAPSFATMLDGMAVKKAVVSIQTAIQDTQRQALRSNQTCSVQVANINVDLASSAASPPSLAGSCLTSGTPALDSNVRIASNVQPLTLPPSSPSAQQIEIRYGLRGSAEFTVLSAVLSPQLPNDPTGKIVAIARNSAVPKQCVALSNILGLARVGVYSGSTAPNDITDTGVCTAMDWTKQ